MNEPTDDDFFFDAAGWVRNDSHRRYELDYKGELIAAITYEQVRLSKAIDGDETIACIIEQAAGILAERVSREDLPPAI